MLVCSSVNDFGAAVPGRAQRAQHFANGAWSLGLKRRVVTACLAALTKPANLSGEKRTHMLRVLLGDLPKVCNTRACGQQCLGKRNAYLVLVKNLRAEVAAVWYKRKVAKHRLQQISCGQEDACKHNLSNICANDFWSPCLGSSATLVRVRTAST